MTAHIDVIRRVQTAHIPTMSALLALTLSTISPAGQSSTANRPDGLAPASSVTRATESTKSSTPLPAFITRNQPKYNAVLAKSRAWLDKLIVDPFELRKHGVKGKTMLALSMDAYVRLYRIGDTADRSMIIARCRDLAAPTFRPDFHDMSTIDERQFHEDATSYLRVAYLLEKLGLDTTLYRRKIIETVPRFNAQLPTRGPHQKTVFAWYYHHFGITYPLAQDEGFKEGFIAKRVPPEMLNLADMYGLTHEIFVPYDYGDNLKVTPFSGEEREYLHQTLLALVRKGIESRNCDITAELISCLAYLGLEDSREYQAGLFFLLDSQNPDGTYGNFEKARPKLGNLVDAACYLHPTAVVIDALTTTFMDRTLSPPR